MTETELFVAYAQTTFVADLPQGSVAIRVNGLHPRLDEWLRLNGWTTWGFATAWNPASVCLALEENRQRHHALIQAVSAMGLPAWPGRGTPDSDSWTPEESLFVPGLTEPDAVGLGRQFGQLAVVWGQVGKSAQLLSCAS